jgi:hypothetical protein
LPDELQHAALTRACNSAFSFAVRARRSSAARKRGWTL